jgi:hypothetical protein
VLRGRSNATDLGEPFLDCVDDPERLLQSGIVDGGFAWTESAASILPTELSKLLAVVFARQLISSFSRSTIWPMNVFAMPRIPLRG